MNHAPMLMGAAVLIWLPRTATLPLTLDAVGAAALVILALIAQYQLRQPAQPADTYV